ncbi:hypothetical protein HY311_01175 [Candidatus Nomurabacteria bacterium]|nr:hypothetical protein [Candidatus Nomurabacteria bacterium]
MKEGRTILWFGYEVVLIAFVCEIGINAYWWALRNGKKEMLSFRTSGNETDDHSYQHKPSKKCSSTKKSRQWLQVKKRTAKVRSKKNSKKKRTVAQVRKDKKRLARQRLRK